MFQSRYALNALFVVCLVTTAPAVSTQSVLVLDLNGLKPGAELSLESRRKAWDELQVASALQGLVNRRHPDLYFLFVGPNGKIDRYWLKRLKATWLEGRKTEPTTLGAALARFKGLVKGLAVWDEHVPATSNVAETAAGVDDLLPCRYDPTKGSMFWRLTKDPTGPRLTVKTWLVRPDGSPLFTGNGSLPGTNASSCGSAKCDAYLWAAMKYLKTGRCQPGFMGYYPDASWLRNPGTVPLERTLLTNADFFIAKRAFFFDLSPWTDEAPEDDPKQELGTDANTLRFLLRKEYELGHGRMTHVGGFTPWDQKYTNFTQSSHEGVPTEWRYAEILSCFNAFMDADAPGLNAMANASFYAHEPLKPVYPQVQTSDQDLMRKGYLLPNGQVAAKGFVSFYVGDYDSAAWLYQNLPEVWDDPSRGSIPLGWAFDPDLEDRFPTGLVYARETATPNDRFISGDSGAGYLNPGYLATPRLWSGLPSGVRAWKAFSEPRFQRWDLGIVGFVIDGYAPAMNDEVKTAYAEFSPAGVVAQKVPSLSLFRGVPFLRMGSDLSGDTQQASSTISAAVKRSGCSFSIFRTILWSPTRHRAVVEALRRLRPDIEVVDPYTLMLLAKHALARH